MVDTNRADDARDFIVEWGGVDGAHHKDWVLDQVVRILCGGEQVGGRITATDDYRRVVAEAKAGVDGPETYPWEEGIAP